MSEISWSTRSIRECLAESFAGEWGAEPLPGNARVLRATDIDDEGHVIGSGALRRLPIGKLMSRQLEDGDILLEGSGGGPDKPVGRVAFFDAAEHQGPAVCSNFFKTLRPDQRVVEPRFLWRKLMWFYRQPTLLTFQQQTTGIINLKFEEYLNAAIEVPADLAEQRAIAQILDTFDTAIRETEALIDKLKAVKQGLLHDLLTRGIDANGQLRPPQSEAPQLYKESPSGWIPREWKSGTLDFWLDGKPKNGYSPQEAGEWTGIQMLGLGCLTIQGFQPLQLKPAPLTDRRLSSALLSDGDLLISRANTRDLVGMVGVYRDVGTPCSYPDLIMRLRPSSETSADFLQFVLQSPKVRRQIQAHAVGTSESMVKISSKIVTNLVVAMPGKAEQEQTLALLAAGDVRLSAELEKMEVLRDIKAGLMDDLLTGRVRVTPLLATETQGST